MILRNRTICQAQYLKYQYAKLIRLPYPKPAALREGRIDLAYTVAAAKLDWT